MIGAMRPDLVFMSISPLVEIRRRGILCPQKECRQLAFLAANPSYGLLDATNRPLFLSARAEDMAGDAVLAVEFERWLLHGAARQCKSAARMEAAKEERRRVG